MLVQENLAIQYQEIRNLSTTICKPLEIEDYVVQPMPDVSPPKWHLGHLSWFFEHFLLSKYQKNYKVFNPEYAYFFNSYYESIGARTIRTDRGNITRPTTAGVYAYREYVDKQMIKFLNEVDPENKEIMEIFKLGLNHEQQHQELLLTDIKYILGNNPILPLYQTTDLKETKNVEKQRWITVKEGIYSIGHNRNNFCFDNEKGIHKTYLHAFQIADRLVTNKEFLEFINSGGYKNFKYWLSEGWEWVKSEKISAPLYWQLINEDWYSYTLNGLQAINLNEPVVHVSFFEADAFARWSNCRLATEFEWETACKLYSPEIPKHANLIESGLFHPKVAEPGNFQFYGDVWEWTNSAYLAYPYYSQAEGAIGEYNGKFMVNQMVLRGGSCATSFSHIRSSYRNFFQTDKRWQFTGIRLTKTIE